MLLKRKRSDDELSFSSGMTFSSPMRADNGDMMDMDSPLSPRSVMSPISRSSTPSHLPSRTTKRFRNGRPSDSHVHQHTLSILFKAQQQPTQPQHVFSPPPMQAATPMSMSQSQGASVQKQSSLHSFWKMPSSSQLNLNSSTPSPSAMSTTSLPLVVDTANQPTSCDDCGVGLGGEDAMMDDGYGFEAFISTCSKCSRPVCFSCSVSNLGEQRRCLMCAGREKKIWVGGVGWKAGGVTVG